MIYKVVSYITAYEDIDSLKRCVISILNQTYPIAEILVVDNSKKSNSDEFRMYEHILKYIHFPENIGISGGLSYALSWSINKQFDFLWTFDQDSEAAPDVLGKLIDYYNILSAQKHKIGMIGPLPIDRVTGQAWHGITFDKYCFKESPQTNSSESYYKCDAIITSGSLVNLDIASKVSLPRKDLFIDAVDWDYCMNFRRCGYEIILVKNAVLNHRFGNAKEVKNIFRKHKVSIYNYSSMRYYYMCRNHTYIETRLTGFTINTVNSVWHRLKFCLILTIKIIFYEEDEKWIKTWACLVGTIYGLLGDLQKSWI